MVTNKMLQQREV